MRFRPPSRTSSARDPASPAALPASDPAVQQRLDQRGRARIDRLAQRQQFVRPALAGSALCWSSTGRTGLGDRLILECGPVSLAGIGTWATSSSSPAGQRLLPPATTDQRPPGRQGFRRLLRPRRARPGGGILEVLRLPFTAMNGNLLPDCRSAGTRIGVVPGLRESIRPAKATRVSSPWGCYSPWRNGQEAKPGTWPCARSTGMCVCTLAMLTVLPGSPHVLKSDRTGPVRSTQNRPQQLAVVAPSPSGRGEQLSDRWSRRPADTAAPPKPAG